jgi:hypothetical protein
VPTPRRSGSSDSGLVGRGLLTMQQYEQTPFASARPAAQQTVPLEVAPRWGFDHKYPREL